MNSQRAPEELARLANEFPATLPRATIFPKLTSPAGCPFLIFVFPIGRRRVPSQGENTPPPNRETCFGEVDLQTLEDSMDRNQSNTVITRKGLSHDFGTFEGFNFREQSAIGELLTAAEVLNWDHDQRGEAEFWPSGDKPEVALIFNHQTNVTASELKQLDAALDDLGDDSTENYLRIYYAVRVRGAALETLSNDDIEDLNLYVYRGDSFLDLRRDAAYELFELFYPDEYAVWEKSTCDGLNFDTDQFLDSPSFYCDEIIIGDEKALLISPQ